MTTLTTWQKTSLRAADLRHQTPLGRSGPWLFYEHPTLGDEHPVLAVHSHGAAVYDTGDFDIPEYC